jgi:CubicO group peptidase (beta-lactamase class C family)
VTEAIPFDQAALVVRRGSDTVFESYRGLSDRDQNHPITAQTRFQIASISKSFTAVASLLMVESGRLTLSDPVWGEITPHHLLTHTSGLGHWPAYPELDLLQPIDPAREIEIFKSHPLAFPPGARYQYSSPGYVVLADLVERAAGVPYRDVISERILRPLAFSNTLVGSHAPDARRAIGYEQGRPTAPFELDTVGRGAGDLWSTASDLAEWMGSLMKGSILKPASRQRMLSPQVAVGDADVGNPVRATHYGYGLSLTMLAGEPLVFHTGHNPGFRALAGFLPDREVAFAYLSNEETTDLAVVMDDLRPMLVSVSRRQR